MLPEEQGKLPGCCVYPDNPAPRRFSDLGPLGNREPVIALGGLRFDRLARQVSIRGETMEISARELSLLEALITQGGRPLGKESLVDHLCARDEAISHNAIVILIHRLRKKLEGSGVRITSVRGVGYLIESTSENPKTGHEQVST